MGFVAEVRHDGDDGSYKRHEKPRTWTERPARGAHKGNVERCQTEKTKPIIRYRQSGKRDYNGKPRTAPRQRV
ncbi:hypothetical protein GCM10017612_29130 [Novosphingobium resinovorum]|nr:hypothetical protein GCM10017612_29130 [Novosphingobium resinovorum]